MPKNKSHFGRHASPRKPPHITNDQPSPRSNPPEEIYRSMAKPARARAPIPATSLAAAPVYLATCGPVEVASTPSLAQLEAEPVAAPAAAAPVAVAATPWLAQPEAEEAALAAAGELTAAAADEAWLAALFHAAQVEAEAALADAAGLLGTPLVAMVLAPEDHAAHVLLASALLLPWAG